MIAATGSDGTIFPNGEAEIEYLWEQWRKLKPGFVDEHFYRSPEWFLENADWYDDYDRDDPKVFVGEYASQSVGVGSPDNRWIDRGMVVRSTEGETDWNAIDGNLVLEGEDKAWLAWESFWGGIKMRRVDRSTGKLSSDDTTLYSIAARPGKGESRTPPQSGAIEAPFIVKHGNYWYLFVSFDFCCRGPQSTYRIMVGRSKSVTGPYVDKEGEPMLEGGGTELLAAGRDGQWVGPGHCAVVQDAGGDYLVFHAYRAQREQGKPDSELKISTIVWEDGWPRVAPLP